MAMIQTLCSDFIFCQFSHHAVDPNLELRWWGSFHLLVLLAFLPLVIYSFLPKIRRGMGVSPRSATVMPLGSFIPGQGQLKNTFSPF